MERAEIKHEHFEMEKEMGVNTGSENNDSIHHLIDRICDMNEQLMERDKRMEFFLYGTAVIHMVAGIYSMLRPRG